MPAVFVATPFADLSGVPHHGVVAAIIWIEIIAVLAAFAAVSVVLIRTYR